MSKVKHPPIPGHTMKFVVSGPQLMRSRIDEVTNLALKKSASRAILRGVAFTDTHVSSEKYDLHIASAKTLDYSNPTANVVPLTLSAVRVSPSKLTSVC